MKIKRSLENRLRGWFPKEPQLISRSCRIGIAAKQPPLIIRPEYTLSATKYVGALAIFGIIFYGFLFSSLNFEWNPFSVFQFTAWIILGVTIGTMSSMVYTRKELGRLSRNFQTNTNWKDAILLYFAPIFVFALFGFFVSRVLFSLTLTGFILSLYAYVVSSLLTRYGLMHFYEKTENMRIMQGWFEGGFAVIPKPPNKKDLN